MDTDALSDVLRVVQLSGGLFIRLNLSAPFSLTTMDNSTVRDSFAPGADHVLPFHLVTQGPIWFDVEGLEPVRLEEGDIIVIPHGAQHSVYDEPGVKPEEAASLMKLISGSPLKLTWEGPGEETKVLCGFFRCNGRLFNPLMESLPEIILIRQDAERTPWLVATIKRTFDETLENRPGGAALVERLTGLLFLEIVQRYLGENAASGWLAGLSDPAVGTALQLIHSQPAYAWTVEELAKRAGASRSILADRFGATVGMSPIKYLTTWRLELAAARLLESSDSIAEVAAHVGYESEASFSRAFKRDVGQPPAEWRNARKNASASVAPAEG